MNMRKNNLMIFILFLKIVVKLETGSAILRNIILLFISPSFKNDCNFVHRFKPVFLFAPFFW